MRCPEEALHAIGKRASGADAQPVVSSDEEAIGCNITCRNYCEAHTFNQCETQGKSDLDTIYLNVDSRDTKKLKFLVNTGNEISIIKGSSLTPGFNYQLPEGIDITGISNTVVRTEGIIDSKLLTDTHETMNTFHNLLNYTPMLIWARVFWKRESVINTFSRQIVMND
jgi:hypothetical protein